MTTLRRAFFFFALAAFAAGAFALDVPPTPTQWFTDAASLLSPDQATALNSKLQAFEQRSGAQFLIYVFPALDDESLEDFTIRCVEKWKVGQKKYDNGIVLFVFVKEKKIRIEVGYGLEPTVTDAFSSRVIRDYIQPKFRESDFAGGLNAGADAIIAQIEHKEAPVAPYQGSSQRSSSSRRYSRGLPSWWIIFPILFFVILPNLRRRGRRTSGCGGCFWPLLFMGGGRGTTFGGGGGGWGGGGGFSGGGGSFGGGGASGGW